MKRTEDWSRIVGLSAVGLLCLALLLGLGFTFLKPDQEPTRAEFIHPPETSSGAHSLAELEDVSNFRSAYLKANGGLKAAEHLHSLRITGTLESDGKSVPFRSIKKRPDKGIFTLSMPEYELSFVVNGDEVWQRMEQPGREAVVTRMTEAQSMATAYVGHFFSPIMHIVLDESSAIQELVADSWEGAPSLRMEFSSSKRTIDGSMHIDPQTMQPLARIDTIGDNQERLIRYKDYRNVEGGIQQPFLIETFVDGKLKNRTQINDVAVNPGVLELVFEYPGEAGDLTRR